MNEIGGRPDAPRTVEGDYRRAQEYWARQAEACPELMGVVGMGGCGLAEVLYRHFEETRHLRRMVAFDQGKTVLELGCGNGRWAISLSPLVGRYVAVDFSRQMLDVARGRVESLGLDNVSFQQADVRDFEPAGHLDVVYLSGVSQYLHDADLSALLGRLAPALRPGGVLVDRSTVHRRQRLLSERSGYFCIYRTAGEMEQLFAEAGLSLHYQRPSYRFLNVPGRLGRLLGTAGVARAVSATAPLSFHMLRLLAWGSERLWGTTGEMLDFSHDFFLFHRGA